MKTMNKTIFKGIIMLLAAMVMTGCDSFLDITPTGKVIAKTGKEYRALLTYEYKNFPEDRGLATLRGDEITLDKTTTKAEDYDSYFDIWAWNDLSQQSTTVSFGWRRYYHAIYIANYIIENKDKITEATADEINQLVGEAYMMRAYCHFLLVNLFAEPYTHCNAATTRGEESFNTSMLWLQDGTAEQSHDKRHPVPFGEYVPDREFFNAIVPDLIGLLQREYTPGTNPPLIDVGDARVGLAICFDVIYDDVIRAGLHGGAEVLVFQTNNADFRETDENLQQLSFARMRAVETGRSVVNVSTVGTSQIIDPDGTTISSLDADEAGALLEDVELRSGLTAGVVLGPWVQQMLLWGGLGMLMFSAWRGRRR